MANDPKSKSKKKNEPYHWEGKDKRGQILRGEMSASTPNIVEANLKRQGITPTKIKKIGSGRGNTVTEKDITLFTRQLATMMKSGVPLIQGFDIVAKGASNPAVARLLLAVKGDVESGLSLSQAFAKHPRHFDKLFCNLIAAGEQAGILDNLLDRLAIYKEKTMAIKAKIKSAMFYPTAVVVASFIIISVIMIYVIPAFKDIFANFGAELPAPTKIVMGISEAFTTWWWAIFGGVGGGIFGFKEWKKRSVSLQRSLDVLSLRAPVFGDLLFKSAVARWTRTLSTMFAAGVPLVEALESVGGASGNYVYERGTKDIQNEVSTGISLTVAMTNSKVSPNMVIQMVSIGEESGNLDGMLSKVADYYEEEVNNGVEALSSLMEPIIMVVLGTIIGGIIIAMYLPIFKMGAAAG